MRYKQINYITTFLYNKLLERCALINSYIFQIKRRYNCLKSINLLDLFQNIASTMYNYVI